jgi:hypothetical protein
LGSAGVAKPERQVVSWLMAHHDVNLSDGIAEPHDPQDEVNIAGEIARVLTP